MEDRPFEVGRGAQPLLSEHVLTFNYEGSSMSSGRDRNPVHLSLGSVFLTRGAQN